MGRANGLHRHQTVATRDDPSKPPAAKNIGIGHGIATNGMIYNNIRAVTAPLLLFDHWIPLAMVDFKKGPHFLAEVVKAEVF